jgi:hypothetical protein
MWCLWRVLHNDETTYAIAKEAGVAWKTVHRWKLGLEENRDAKISCFPQLGKAIMQGVLLGKTLLTFLKDILGDSRLSAGARAGMIRLHNKDACPLY